MDINAIKAEITRLQALLDAQAPEIGEEVKIDLGDTQEQVNLKTRAANFEPALRGSQLAKNPSVTGGALKSTSNAEKLPQVVKGLATLCAHFGPSFRRPDARRWLYDNTVTAYGEFKRWNNEGGVNTTMSGWLARANSEAPGLIKVTESGRVQTWTIDLHLLTELSK